MGKQLAAAIDVLEQLFFNLDFSGSNSNSDEEECEDIMRFSGPPLSASMLRVEAFLDDIISGKASVFVFVFVL